MDDDLLYPEYYSSLRRYKMYMKYDKETFQLRVIMFGLGFLIISSLFYLFLEFLKQ